MFQKFYITIAPSDIGDRSALIQKIDDLERLGVASDKKAGDEIAFVLHSYSFCAIGYLPGIIRRLLGVNAKVTKMNEPMEVGGVGRNGSLT